jgi:DNA-binding transcriptional MocR family regulator
VAQAAEARGVLVEEAARHWEDPALAPSSLVLGYGPLSEPAIRRGIRVLAEAIRSGRSAAA